MCNLGDFSKNNVITSKIESFKMILNVVIFLVISAVHARERENPVHVEKLRWDFLMLEEELWKFVQNYVNNNTKNLDIRKNYSHNRLIKTFQVFGDNMTEVFPYNTTHDLNVLQKIWSLRQVYADIKSITTLYEIFRRLQKQQTVSQTLSSKEAWTNFSQTVLYDSQKNVEQAASRIHHLIGNILDKVEKETESNIICNSQSQQSAQQVLFNLYNAIALTELKSYIMIQFSYMLLGLYDKGDFRKEAQLRRKRYKERTSNAINIVRNSLKNVSRELWNCDPKIHKKGETYEEITELLQGYVQNEVDLNFEGTCRENCLTYYYTENYNCFKNLYCSQQRRCSGKIINCQFYDSLMWICPANPFSGRRYEYIEYENGKILGKKQYCSRGTKQVESWWRYLFVHCTYCFCLCDEQGSNSDRYWNMRSVIADIENNRVVTGLRFVKKNRIIHLQIQEGKLLPEGKIDQNTVRWVPVENYKITDRKIYYDQDYHTFTWERRAIDLDDLEADEGYILTGVRFKQIGTHLNFEIFVTQFDIYTGKLTNPFGTSFWKDNTNTDSAIENPRTKVWLSHPDIPTLSPTASIPTSKSNQYIEFVNSDIDSDAAQNTVPFLDAQKLESLQPVPLSGAGIFHKGNDNYGGFITPKIITYDFSKHLKAALPAENVIS